jgi:RHH-type transcriptional regulator, proline utilization regulon repressor / proline dehydrogenase / delta 1-pyrroline-5-carboxylate dehydrogenase
LVRIGAAAVDRAQDAGAAPRDDVVVTTSSRRVREGQGCAMTVTMPGRSDDVLVEAAIETAQRWLAEASRVSRQERRTADQLGSLLADEAGLDFATGFVDRVTRAESDRVAAAALQRIVASGGAVAFLGPIDRLLLRVGAALAPVLPWIVVPLARRRLRQLVGHMVLDATPRDLARQLDRARGTVDGALNVNLLGEAVLGATEARRRRDATIALIARDDVDYVSVKLSSITAQLLVWDLDATVARIADELRPVYRAAMAAPVPTFVNLDVEEYRDLDLTIEVFTRVLSEPAFRDLRAGIVLQAYLPDALGALERLLAFAAARHGAGGADIRIRLVKGANLSMEHVESELRGWPAAPYATKHATDANYKRLVDVALREDALLGARIGLASHNLLDVAWALEVARARGVEERLDIEMLQGMAPGSARAVRGETGGLRLYTPVVDPSDFDVAISYLVRRLEEVASPDNFLRSFLAMADDPVVFDAEVERFRAAVADRHHVSTGPQRDQDRRLRSDDPSARRSAQAQRFVNEEDTDPALAANRSWAAEVAASPFDGPRSALVTDVATVDAIVAAARAAGVRWAASSGEQRRAVLRRAADELAARRGELVAAMLHEGRKTIGEADPEVSELVDFARYYAERAPELAEVHGAVFDPHRLVLVVPPWNFPTAIPGGGALAAIAAGGAAILKPAPEVPRCGELVVEAIRAALVAEGVEPELCTLLRVPDDATGQHLVTHPHIDAVILTGSFETAQLFRGWRPDLELLAETSGKNALIVTPSADLDLAVADLVRSAFGHAGQKCSAASLAILVGDVASSRRFLDQLVDAARTLRAGAATDLSTQLNGLIGPARGPLARHLTTLDDGESWLVEPVLVDATRDLWTPGIKLGVRAGSHFHTTECFGPVLGIMAAQDLDEAIAWQNSTGYGLTGGIHSLDDGEVEHWLAHVEVGNAYVNRHITGAIVQRQPFGGWKRSSVGPGVKAGGPAYVAALGRWRDSDGVAALADADWLAAAREDDAVAWTTHFAGEADATGLTVEANVLRHRPYDQVVLRVGPEASARAMARVLVAAARCGTPVVLSRPAREGSDADATDAVIADAEALIRADERAATTVSESGSSLEQRIASAGQVVVRAVGVDASGLRVACERAGVRLVAGPVVMSGRVELGRLLREQAVSRTRHRYGRVTG